MFFFPIFITIFMVFFKPTWQRLRSDGVALRHFFLFAEDFLQKHWLPNFLRALLDTLLSATLLLKFCYFIELDIVTEVLLLGWYTRLAVLPSFTGFYGVLRGCSGPTSRLRCRCNSNEPRTLLPLDSSSGR